MLYLYQSYFREEDRHKIAYPDFIPWDNTENRQPWMREYPMWKNATFKHQREADAYWGILSVKWWEKTNVEPKVFKEWIEANPGYDLYYIDPFNFTPQMFPNTWVQGEQWHPGIIEYHDRILKLINYRHCHQYSKRLGELKTEKLIFNQDDFITANYYIGNGKFWYNWLSFLDACLYESTRDEYCFNFLYTKGGIYNGTWIPNFPFVTERLVTTFAFLYQNLKVKRFGYN